MLQTTFALSPRSAGFDLVSDRVSGSVKSTSCFVIHIIYNMKKQEKSPAINLSFHTHMRLSFFTTLLLVASSETKRSKYKIGVQNQPTETGIPNYTDFLPDFEVELFLLLDF